MRSARARLLMLLMKIGFFILPVRIGLLMLPMKIGLFDIASENWAF